MINTTNSDQAMQLLTLLRDEGICNPENTSGSKLSETCVKLRILRPLIQHAASQYQAPGLTGSVALTLLKVGACQELVHRFAVEYFLRFKKATVSIIYTANANISGPNHCFNLIGEVVADDELIVGRNPGPLITSDKKFFIPIKEFLDRQKEDAALADPLLDFTDSVKGPCVALLNYCNRNKITHVIGVRKYIEIFVEHAEEIKANAVLLSNSLK